MSLFADYSDERLVDAIRNGNEDAFAELFNRHWQKVHKLAYSKVRNREATEEIVQDLFIKLWDKRADLSIQNVGAYLYTCVKHRCLNYIESQIAQKKHWEYYKTFLPVSDESTGNAVAFGELMEAIEAGIDLMPEKGKKVFRLNRFEGRSVKEIAHLLNLSEKAIEYYLTQSTKKLRAYLKEFILFVLIYIV